MSIFDETDEATELFMKKLRAMVEEDIRLEVERRSKFVKEIVEIYSGMTEKVLDLVRKLVEETAGLGRKVDKIYEKMGLEQRKKERKTASYLT